MDGTVEKMEVDIDLDIKDVEKLLPLRKSENDETELKQDGFVKNEYASDVPQQNNDGSEKLVTILGSVTEDQVKEFTMGAENIAERGQMITANQLLGPDAPSQQQLPAAPIINSLRSHRRSVAETPEVAEKPGRSEKVDRVDKPETRSERTRSERLERSARVERPAPVEKVVVEKERKLSKSRHFWPKEDVLKMIDVWRERVVELRSSRKNGHIYTEMSLKLGTMGVEVEAIEIRIKINNLTQKYKTEKAKGGTSDWEFFIPVHTVFEVLKAANPDLPDDSPVDTEDSKLNLWEEIDKKMEILDTDNDKDYDDGDINNDRGDNKSDKADKIDKNDKNEKNEKIPKTTTTEQYKMMVDFINEHKIMLKERRSVAENRDVENLWNELGVILNNAENAPNRDAKKWRRTFIEWRSKTRNKLRGKDGINNESFTPEEKILLELCARIVSEELQTDGEDGDVNDPNVEKPENRIEKLEKTEKILKTTAEQYKQIVDFINVHKIMVKERRSLAENKDVEALWNELSLLLNKTENGANRDGRKWRRYFIEWRSKTRNKLKGLKDGINSETLSQEEKDLLELCARIASEDLQAELEDAVSDKSANDVGITDASGDVKSMMMPSQMFQSPNMSTPNMHLMAIPPHFQSTPQKHPTLTQRNLAQTQKLQKVSSTSKTRPATKPKTSSAKAATSAPTASASRSVSPAPSSASSDDDESPAKNSNNKRAKKSIQHRILDEIVKANKLAEKELEESRKFSAKAHHLEEKRVKITEYFMQRSLAIQETLVTFMDYHQRGGSF